MQVVYELNAAQLVPNYDFIIFASGFHVEPGTPPITLKSTIRLDANKPRRNDFVIVELLGYIVVIKAVARKDNGLFPFGRLQNYEFAWHGALSPNNICIETIRLICQCQYSFFTHIWICGWIRLL